MHFFIIMRTKADSVLGISPMILADECENPFFPNCVKIGIFLVHILGAESQLYALCT